MVAERVVSMHAPVTVAVTTRNRAALLGDCLRSLRDQLLLPSVVVVSDDGSTDRTAEVVESFRPDFRGRGIELEFYRHDPPLGQEANRRFALSRAGTPLVACLDDDDMWDRRFLAATVPLLQDERVDLVGTGILVVDGVGAIDLAATERLDATTGRDRLEACTLENWLERHVCSPLFLLGNIVVRRPALVRIGWIPPGSGRVCDFATFVALAADGCVARWVPEHLFHYRLHGEGRESDRSIEGPRDLAEWLHAFAVGAARGDEQRRVLLERALSAHRAVFLMVALSGRRLEASGHLMRIVRRYGLRGPDWKEVLVAARRSLRRHPADGSRGTW
jgi:glycosyltransferase involved in cell wall biosynthesis